MAGADGALGVSKLEASPIAVRPADSPVFRVVAIGDKGSGKTNLLAMLYRHLSIDPDGGRGFHLSTDTDTRIILTEQAATAANPLLEWTYRTTWVEGVDLTFQVPLASAPLGVVHIHYTDYPGEYLRDRTAGTREQREALRDAIDGADALFMLVDGYKLLKALRGDVKDVRELSDSLEATVAEVQRGPMAGGLAPAPPLHVLVTKWDFLADAGKTLPQVREALLEEEHFRAMISARRSNASRQARAVQGRVRIIPVSVLGCGAIKEVIEQQQDGTVVDVVVKKPSFRHEPINLAVPIAAIIPDRLDQILAELSPRKRRRAQRRVRLALLRRRGRWIRRFGGRIVEATQDGLGTLAGTVLGPLGKDLAKPVLALVAEWLMQEPNSPVDVDAAEGRVQAMRRIETRAVLARRDLLKRFAEQVESFERDFDGWDAEAGLEEWSAKRRKAP